MRKENNRLSSKQQAVINSILNLNAPHSKKYIALPAAPGSGKTTTLLSAVENFFSIIGLKKDIQKNKNGDTEFFFKGYTSHDIKSNFSLDELDNINRNKKILILSFSKSAIDEFTKRADKINIKTIEPIENDDNSIAYIEKDTKLSLMIEASTYHSLLLKAAKPIIEKLGYIPDYSKASFFKKDIEFINKKHNLGLKKDDISFSHNFIEKFHNSPLDFSSFSKEWNIHENKKIDINTAKTNLFIINSLYDEMKKHNVTMPHSFYYKLVHKYAKNSPEFLSNIFKNNKGNEYSMVLVDEAQDSDEIIYDLIKRSNKKAIFVGDTFQNIYGFRGTYNVFTDLLSNEIKNTYFFDLSESFRYGKAIATLTSSIPKIFQHENKDQSETFGMSDSDYIHPKPIKIKDIIKLSSNVVTQNLNEKKQKRETSNEIAIICRSNKRALEIYSELKKDEFISSYVKIESGLKSKTKDFISKGANAIEDEVLKEEIIRILGDNDFSFENILNSEDACNLLQNTEYAYLLKCRDEKLKNAMLQKSSGYETVTIITVHGSKGLEYKKVILADDYIRDSGDEFLIGFENDSETKKLSNDEINIIYTGATRAKESLFLMDSNLFNQLSEQINISSQYNCPKIERENRILLETNIEVIESKKNLKNEEEENKNNIITNHSLFL